MIFLKSFVKRNKTFARRTFGGISMQFLKKVIRQKKVVKVQLQNTITASSNFSWTFQRATSRASWESKLARSRKFCAFKTSGYFRYLKSPVTDTNVNIIIYFITSNRFSITKAENFSLYIQHFTIRDSTFPQILGNNCCRLQACSYQTTTGVVLRSS